MVYYLIFIWILSVISLIKVHAQVCLAFWWMFMMDENLDWIDNLTLVIMVENLD